MSTSHLGYSAFDGSDFVEAGCFDLPKDKEIFEKIDLTVDFIVKKCTNLNIKDVYIEQYASKFASNKSSIFTILTLAGFIETVNYCLYKNNISVKMINVNSARKLAGVVLPKKTNRDLTKLTILKFIQNKISEEQCSLLYEMKPRVPKPKDHCFDCADAIIISLAAAKQNP